EGAMNMMKMPLDKAEEMKEGAMNMMKMPLDKAGEMKENAMNMMKMPLDKAGEMKENAMNMMKEPLEKTEGMKEDVVNMIKLPLDGGDAIKQGVGDLMKMPLEVVAAMKQASDDLMKKAESMKREAADLKPSPMEKVEDLMKMHLEKFEEKKEEVVDLTKLHIEIFKEMKENASDSMSNIMDKIGELSDAKKEQIAPMVEVISKMPTALEEMVEKLVQPKMKEDVKQMIIDLYGEDVVKELKREFKRAVGIMAAEGVKEDMKRMLTDLLANNIMEDMKADLTQAAPDLMKNSTKDMEESVKEVIIDIIEQAKDPKAMPQPIPPKDGDENMKEMLKEAMDKMEGSGPGMQEEGTEMKDLKEKMEEPASNSLPEPTPNSPPTTMGNGESNMNSSNSDAMERKIILQNQVDKEQAIAESVMRLLNMGPHRGRRHWQGGSRGFMRQGRIGNGWRWRSKRSAPNRPVLRRPNLSNDVNEFPPPARLASPMFTAYRQVNSAAPPAPYDRSKESLKLPLLSINEPATNIILDDIKAGLQYALQTRNEITIPIHGTGTTGGAALIDNLVEPGDVVLAAINGYWTELLANMSQRHDARVIRYRKPAGTRFSVKEIETALRTHRPKLLLMTQGESSTTVNQPMDGIGDLCRRYGTLLVVDVVAAAGIQPVKMDQNKIDAVFTSSHKGFGGVVGLAVVSLSDRAVSKIRNRRTPPRSYQTDILSQAALVNTSADATAMRFQSISLPLLYGLREALATIAAEGIENTYRRHERATKQLDDGMTALGLQHYLTDPNLRMVGISAFRVPRGKDPLKIEQYMWRNHNIEISIGFGPTARQILRLATFASNADPAKVQNIITAATS
ncbi:Serine--pyruvate aminotransferase, mitochondrial, partial [Orchesella cincta]